MHMYIVNDYGSTKILQGHIHSMCVYYVYGPAIFLLTGFSRTLLPNFETTSYFSKQEGKANMALLS